MDKFPLIAERNPNPAAAERAVLRVLRDVIEHIRRYEGEDPE